MAINFKNIAEKVMRILQGNGLSPKLFSNEDGKSVAVPEDARYFYVQDPNIMIFIDDNSSEIKFHIGENVDINTPKVEKMINLIKNLSKSNLMDFDIRTFGKHIEPKNYTYNIETNSKHSKEQEMSDVLGEGLSPLEGSAKTSRQTLENVRLIIRHKASVNEEQRGARSRNISAIFVENSDGERFKYPNKHLSGARAMARHVSNGGVPSDLVGEAIIEQTTTLVKLKEFMNIVNKQGLVNETNRDIVLNVKRQIESVKESIKRIQGTKGYTSFVESLALNEAGKEKLVCKDCGDEQHKPTTDCKHDCDDESGSWWVKKSDLSEDTMNDYISKFTKSTFEDKLIDILPLIHRANTTESENQKTNQLERVKNIIEACNEDGSPVNTISYRDSNIDISGIKKTELDEDSKTPSLAQKFVDLASRIHVESCDDNRRHDRSNDRAAELSVFLRNIAEQVKVAPHTVARESLEMGARLVKMADVVSEDVVETTIEDKIDDMLSEAFKPFNYFD
ncbi:hypothetical protein N9I00_00940 [bacterium]|nr:hypothetical protein [bacterium]